MRWLTDSRIYTWISIPTQEVVCMLIPVKNEAAALWASCNLQQACPSSRYNAATSNETCSMQIVSIIIMPWYLHQAFKNSPAIAPHPDSSPSLLRTASCSAGGRACVFPGCCVHLVVVVVMPVLDHCGGADCAEFAARSGRRTLIKWGGYRTVSVRACPVSAGQPVSVSAAARQQQECVAPMPPLPATQRRTTTFASSWSKTRMNQRGQEHH